VNLVHLPDSRWLIKLEKVRIGASQPQQAMLAELCFVMCCHAVSITLWLFRQATYDVVVAFVVCQKPTLLAEVAAL
jgi:hypothetical protein